MPGRREISCGAADRGLFSPQATYHLTIYFLHDFQFNDGPEREYLRAGAADWGL